MASYKVVQRVFLAPSRHLAGGGWADADTNEDLLAVDERGRPELVYRQLAEGDLVYSEPGDFDKLDEEQQQKAAYSPDEAVLQVQQKLGALEEVDADENSQEEEDDSSREADSAANSELESNRNAEESTPRKRNRGKAANEENQSV